MEDSFSNASAPAAATSTDAEAERKAKTKAARSPKAMQREREKANKELPLANRVAPFVRVDLEDRHGALPRGPGARGRTRLSAPAWQTRAGTPSTPTEGFVMSYGVSTSKRLAKTSEFVANRRQLVSLGRAHGRATYLAEYSIPGPPIESEDGRGNMWYGHEQRNVIGYPVLVAAHIDGKIVHLDSDDRCIEARRQGHFFTRRHATNPSTRASSLTTCTGASHWPPRIWRTTRLASASSFTAPTPARSRLGAITSWT